MPCSNLGFPRRLSAVRLTCHHTVKCSFFVSTCKTHYTSVSPLFTRANSVLFAFQRLQLIRRGLRRQGKEILNGGRWTNTQIESNKQNTLTASNTSSWSLKTQGLTSNLVLDPTKKAGPIWLRRCWAVPQLLTSGSGARRIIKICMCFWALGCSGFSHCDGLVIHHPPPSLILRGYVECWRVKAKRTTRPPYTNSEPVEYMSVMFKGLVQGPKSEVEWITMTVNRGGVSCFAVCGMRYVRVM